MSLQAEKIKKARAAATPINYRSISVNAGGKLVDSFQKDLDNRIINGYLIIWGQKNMFGEKVIRGACAKSISERGPDSNANYKITFLWMHDPCDPLAVFAELVEDEIGLRFRTLPLDNVPNGDRCITQVRSGTLNQFSVGFNYVWDKIYYDETDDSLVLTEIDFREGSVVTMGADAGTFALRSGQTFDDAMIEFNDEMENYIKSIPRKQQNELRALITRHKTLLENKPGELRRVPLVDEQPDEPAISIAKQILKLI